MTAEKNGCNLCCNPFSLFHLDELPKKANQKDCKCSEVTFLISVLPMGVLNNGLFEVILHSTIARHLFFNSSSAHTSEVVRL